MSRTLYEINADLESCFDPETGELDEEKWNALTEEWERKVEGVALYLKNQTMLLDGMENEKKNLDERIKSLKNQCDGLKQFLQKAIKEIGGNDKFETPKVRVSFRKSESVDIIEEQMIPEKYFDIQTVRKPIKKAIKEAIKKGELIEGAVIKENYNTIIK